VSTCSWIRENEYLGVDTTKWFAAVGYEMKTLGYEFKQLRNYIGKYM